MVDGISIISPKIKSFDENISDNNSFPDSEPFEKEIFYDVRGEDRICAQCGQDHSFKQNFKDIKTSIEHIPELIPLIFKEDSMENV